jgi:hypothetical protein
MTTTAPTNPYPDIQPPAGTEPDIWEVGLRDDTTDACRTVRSETTYGVGPVELNWRDEPMARATVYASAVRWADGSIDDGRRAEAPKVFVDINCDSGLTRDQARELAAVLIAAAEEIDSWCPPAGNQARGTVQPRTASCLLFGPPPSLQVAGRPFCCDRRKRPHSACF